MPPTRRSGGATAARAATTTTTTITKDNKQEARPRRAATTTTTAATTATTTATPNAADATVANAAAPIARVTTTKTTTAKKSRAAAGPTQDREARLWAKGLARVAGVDEAGRGPLAGPVVAAACVLPAGGGAGADLFPGLDDSKKLDEPAREALYAAITGHPGVAWCVRVEDHESIDRINILQATMRAMRRAVEGLSGGGGVDRGQEQEENQREGADEPQDAAAIPDPAARRSALRLPPDYALIDGNRVPPGLPCPAEAVVGGDGKCSAIAAASVIAKVTRDRAMLDLERRFPGYGLGQHKGYGVPQHVAAVRRLGPSDVHRRSFEPVKSMVGWTREAMLAREAAAAEAVGAAAAQEGGAAVGMAGAAAAAALAAEGAATGSKENKKNKGSTAGAGGGGGGGRGKRRAAGGDDAGRGLADQRVDGDGAGGRRAAKKRAGVATS